MLVMTSVVTWQAGDDVVVTWHACDDVGGDVASL
jgi:hypothetical protein